jgi:hypothetical protein
MDGFKLVNPDCIDPNTGKKVVILNMQSDSWCFPIMTIIAKYNTIYIYKVRCSYIRILQQGSQVYHESG